MTAADDLRALSAAATPGPWRNGFPRVIAATGGEARDLAFSVSRVADARLIVWCRNHADALADLIDAASDHTTTEDVGDEWREHARLRFMDALDALEADRG